MSAFKFYNQKGDLMKNFIKTSIASVILCLMIFWGKSAYADTSPSTLNMSMWLQSENYNSSTGVCSGSSSTGGSGSVTASEFWSKPYAGTALNGYQTMRFDGYNGLVASTHLNNLISSTHWSAWVLTKATADTSGTDGNNPAWGYNANAILASSNFDWGIARDGSSYSSTSAIAWQTVGGGGNNYGAQPSFSEGVWQLIQAYSDGTNVCARVNSGSWDCNTAGTWSSYSNDDLYIGLSFSNWIYYDGFIANVGLSTTTFSQSTFDGIKDYMNTKYNLSL